MGIKTCSCGSRKPELRKILIQIFLDPCFRRDDEGRELDSITHYLPHALVGARFAGAGSAGTASAGMTRGDWTGFLLPVTRLRGHKFHGHKLRRDDEKR